MHEQAVSDRNHDGVHQIIGIEFPLDTMKVFPDGTLADPRLLRDLLDDLPHRPMLQDGALTLRQKGPWTGMLQRAGKHPHDLFEARLVDLTSLCGTHRHDKVDPEPRRPDAACQPMLHAEPPGMLQNFTVRFGEATPDIERELRPIGLHPFEEYRAFPQHALRQIPA